MNYNIVKAILLVAFTLLSNAKGQAHPAQIVENYLFKRLNIKSVSDINSVDSLDNNSKDYYNSLLSNWEASIGKLPEEMTGNPSLRQAHSALRYLMGVPGINNIDVNVPPGFLYWPSFGVKNSEIKRREVDLKLMWLKAYLKDGKIENSPQLLSVARSILTDIGNPDIGTLLTESHFQSLIHIYSSLTDNSSKSSKDLLNRLFITFPISTQLSQANYRNYITSILKTEISSDELTTLQVNRDIAANLVLLGKASKSDDPKDKILHLTQELEIRWPANN